MQLVCERKTLIFSVKKIISSRNNLSRHFTSFHKKITFENYWFLHVNLFSIWKSCRIVEVILCGLWSQSSKSRLKRQAVSQVTQSQLNLPERLSWNGSIYIVVHNSWDGVGIIWNTVVAVDKNQANKQQQVSGQTTRQPANHSCYSLYNIHHYTWQILIASLTFS